MTESKAAKAERELLRQESIDYLRPMLKPGTEVATLVTHVARSGMSRSIKCYVIHNGTLHHITGHVARLTGNSVDHNNGGVKVGGCGMDMGFAIVYSLGRTLYPDGFRCAGKSCPSNDHSNPRHVVHRDDDGWVEGLGMCHQPGYVGPMERDGKSKHRGDGGYALNQRWI